MELYFLANDIADVKKVAVLLSCIGGKVYRIVKSLLAPNLLISKSFPAWRKFSSPILLRNITELFHFNQKATIWRINCWFHCWVAPAGYNCKFEDKLEDALRDKFGTGLQSEAMHKQSLTETERLFCSNCGNNVEAWKQQGAHMNPMITQASSTLLTISLAALWTKEPQSLPMSF